MIEHFIMTLMAIMFYDRLKKLIKHWPTSWVSVRFKVKYSEWLPNPKSPVHVPVGYRTIKHLVYARVGRAHIQFWTTRSPWVKDNHYGDKEFKEAMGAYGEAGR